MSCGCQLQKESFFRSLKIVQCKPTILFNTQSHGLQINITRIKSNESFLEIGTGEFEKMTAGCFQFMSSSNHAIQSETLQGWRSIFFAVLFVFSLNDICQTKAGSIRNNNRVRNKQIFADVLKNEALSKTPIILILNKLDDFQEELKEAKFREEWRGYTGLQEETEILWVHSFSHSF